MSLSRKVAEPYRERNIILRRLGYANYKTYLQSDDWRIIRNHILKKWGKCVVCVAPKATEVHHLRYDEPTLIGARPHMLIALCRTCHERAEFGDDDSKESLADANYNLFQMLWRSKEATARHFLRVYRNKKAQDITTGLLRELEDEHKAAVGKAVTREPKPRDWQKARMALKQHIQKKAVLLRHALIDRFAC